MNKAYNGNRNSLLFVLVMCLVLFNGVFLLAGCGLDTFYDLKEPVVDSQIPTVGNDGPDLQVFKFNTSENNPGISIIGTDVYYKIYSDNGNLESDVNKLVKKQKDSVDSLLYELKNDYKYSLLQKSNDRNDIFVSWKGSSQRVEIRLSNYTEEFPAKVLVDGNSKGIPLRNYQNKSFDFFDKDNAPNITENDVYTNGSSTSISEWYVAMFAVTSGHDEKWSNIYSKIVYLGAVTIKGKK